jgi:ATP-dependent Clp protease ATP-binding subunit ClpC
MKRFSVGSEQLLLGLFLEKSGLASEVLVEFDLTFNMLKQQAEGYGVCDPLVTVKDKLPFTSSVLKILDNSSRISTELGHGYISTEHLFLALLEDQPGRGMQILRTYNVKTMLLRIKINAAIGASDKHAKRMKAMICSFSDTPNLDSYTENLTEMVFDEKLHIIYGRTNEIDVLIRILGRRTKNNPLLLGESGVGKTAVVEGLALQCATLHVPEFLKAAILMRIDMKQVLMGSGVKTEFDDRITAVLNEIIGLVGYSIPYSTPIYPILVLDDMHTIVGSNAAESGFDASTIIKFALQTGKFSCIGITTNEDYKTHIEPDVRLSSK